MVILLKVNNWNITKICEICSKFKLKTTVRRHLRRFGVFIIIFEYISHIFLVDFEHVNADRLDCGDN